MSVSGWGIRAGALAVVLGTVCAATEITDVFGSAIDQLRGGQPAMLRLAPIVVVAKVRSNDVVGSARYSTWTPQVLVVPRRVTCELENVLRVDGEAEIAADFSFVYFALAEANAYNPYYKELFQAVRGERYIFPLIRQGDVLRSIGDVGPFSIDLFAGRHYFGTAPFDPTPIGWNEAAFGERISTILLSVGRDFDAARYVHELYRYRVIAEVLGSRLRTFELLRDLLNGPPPVREAACFELNHSFPGQSPCLERIANDEQEHADVRSRALARLREVARLEEILLAQLRNPAQLGFPGLMNTDSRSQNYQELLLLLRHPRAEFRREACKAIHRYFPYMNDEKCAER